MHRSNILDPTEIFLIIFDNASTIIRKYTISDFCCSLIFFYDAGCTECLFFLSIHINNIKYKVKIQRYKMLRYK